MKRKSRMILSLALSLVLLFTCVGTALTAFAAQQGEADPSPIIYVIGRTSIYNDPSSPDRKIIAKAYGNDAKDAVTEALPYLAKAILLGQWKAYEDKAYDLFMQFFEGYACNDEGEPDNGTGNDFSWSEESLSRDYQSNNPYTYRFEYDARRSPLLIADDLNDYIEAVKRVTGKETVSIISRCLGVCIAMAYIQKYQAPVSYAGLDTVVFYDSSFLGIDVLEAAMSGTVKIEADAAGAFLTDFGLTTGNETIDAILPMTLQMLRDTYGIEITAGLVQNIYRHIRSSLVPRLLMSTFGTTPGYWSMVFDHYDEAKAYLFDTAEKRQKYAGLIEKIDAYHNNVQVPYKDIIAGMQNAGVEVAAVCKYGFRGYPVYEGANAVGDGVTTLKKQSFGAMCSDFDGTLDPAYIADREAKGYGAYISPDKQIDASAGLLPDTTWYIKNNEHDPFHDCINPLLNAICRKESFSVTDDPAWPQYLYLVNSGTVVPMTEENCDPDGAITHTGTGQVRKNPFAVMLNFFRWVKELFKTLFQMMKK